MSSQARRFGPAFAGRTWPPPEPPCPAVPRGSDVSLASGFGFNRRSRSGGQSQTLPGPLLPGLPRVPSPNSADASDGGGHTARCGVLVHPNSSAIRVTCVLAPLGPALAIRARGIRRRDSWKRVTCARFDDHAGGRGGAGIARLAWRVKWGGTEGSQSRAASGESHLETDALCEGVGADRLTTSGRPDDAAPEFEDGVRRMSRARVAGLRRTG